MPWLATEAMGTNEVTTSTRGFAKHRVCCRDGQGKGTPGRLVSDVPFQDSLLHQRPPLGELSSTDPLHCEVRT